MNLWGANPPGYCGEDSSALEEDLLKTTATIEGIFDYYIEVGDGSCYSTVPFIAISAAKNVIKLSEDYDAVIEDDGTINVGCTTVNFETLEEIYNTACEIREESGY